MVRRALRWLAGAQEPDGHFTNVWFRGRTAGTTRILHALTVLGLLDSPIARRAAGWLVRAQLPDGAWDDGLSPAGEGTVEETAWAVLALAGSTREDERRAAARGVAWLLRAQRSDGRFEPSLVGIYFLGLTYHCDHIADAYALQALIAWHGSPPHPARPVGTGDV